MIFWKIVFIVELFRYVIYNSFQGALYLAQGEEIMCLENVNSMLLFNMCRGKWLVSFGKYFIYANMYCTYVVNNSLTFQGNQTQSSPKHLTVLFEKLSVVHAFHSNVDNIHLIMFYITYTHTTYVGKWWQ